MCWERTLSMFLAGALFFGLALALRFRFRIQSNPTILNLAHRDDGHDLPGAA